VTTTNTILIGVAFVFLLLYFLRRRSRLSRDDD
jgi:LPXTG-motif cell wall-anchored protein